MRHIAWLCAMACGLMACGLSHTDMGDNDFGAPAPVTMLPDDSPCESDESCESGACARVMPISPHGVCVGPASTACMIALVFDTWAEKPCTDYGMTVALCAMTDAERKTRCKVPDEEPSGTYPYPYVCCETTMFE